LLIIAASHQWLRPILQDSCCAARCSRHRGKIRVRPTAPGKRAGQAIAGALISLQITGNSNAVFTVLINIWSAKAVYSLDRIIARDQQLVWP
jgi:hypothetical protein